MQRIQWTKETTSLCEGFVEAQLNILKWLCCPRAIWCEELCICLSKGPGVIVFCWQQTHSLLFAGSSSNL